MERPNRAIAQVRRHPAYGLTEQRLNDLRKPSADLATWLDRDRVHLTQT